MINVFQSRPQSRAYRKISENNTNIIKTSDEQHAQKCFTIGKQHQNRKQFDKAQKFYLQAIIHNPNHFKALCNLGSCLRIKGKYQDAIIAYKKAKRINNNDSITNYNLANVYRITGNQQKAIELYKLVIKLQQQQNTNIGHIYTDSYTNLGICYKNIGKFNEAIQCYNFIKKQQPNDKQIAFNQAVCYMQLLKSMCKNRLLFKLQMLIRQITQKTQNLLNQILKYDDKNQTVLISLIQIQYLREQSKENLQKCISKLSQILNNPNSSSYIKKQCQTMKKLCQNMIVKKEQEKNRLVQSRQSQIDNVRKYDQKRSQKQITKDIKSNTQIVKDLKSNQPISSKRSTNLNKSQPQTNTTQQVNHTNELNNSKLQNEKLQKNNLKQQLQNIQLELKKCYDSFTKIILQRIQNSIKENIPYVQIQNECVEMIGNIQVYESNNKMSKSQRGNLSEEVVKRMKQNQKRLKKQLMIVLYSIMSEQLSDAIFLTKAEQIYSSFFPNNDINVKIQKDMFFLDTHRAAAYILTNLGQSQKAIQHFQIINRQYHNNGNNTIQLQQLHLGLAVNYQSQGQYQKAIVQYEKASSFNSDNFILLYNLANCHLLSENTEEAIDYFQRFVKIIKQQQYPQSDQVTKKYFYMALVNIFLCFEGQLTQSAQKFEQVQTEIQNDFNNNISFALQTIDPEMLMRFYLKGCDIFQQIIQKSFIQKKTNENVSLKQYKQKILTIYINLLELPQCPDRDIILINCGNMLFEQKQFLRALDFYSKVNNSKYQVFNNIALTYFNLNQYAKAIQYMEQSLKNDSQNPVYKFNYQLILWSIGAKGINNQNNQFIRIFNCKCQGISNSRIQYSKSLFMKFINYVQKVMYKQKYQNEQSNIQKVQLKQLVQQMVQRQEKQQNWKQQEHFRKHFYLKNYILKHCKQHNNVKEITKQQILGLLEISCLNYADKNQLKNKLAQLINKLKKYEHCSNYKSTSQTLLAIFGYKNTSNKQQQSNYINLVKELIPPQTSSVSIQFNDHIFNQQIQYPCKTFKIIYPSIELKLQNLVQTLHSWHLQLEDKITYVHKIIDTLAYQHQISQPIYIEYVFSHAKHLIYPNDVQRDSQTQLIRAIQLFYQLFNLKQQYQEMKTLASKNRNFQQVKQQIVSRFKTNLSKSLQQQIVADGQQNQNDQFLQIKLNSQTLPLVLYLNFQSYSLCRQFITALSKQLQVKQIQANQSERKYTDFILNKLIRFRCSWKDRNYVEQILQSMLNSKFNINEYCLLSLNSQLISEWKSEQKLNQMLKTVFGEEIII